jgi:hypothetical protein
MDELLADFAEFGADLMTTPIREGMAIALAKDKLRGRHQITVVCAFLRNGFLLICL